MKRTFSLILVALIVILGLQGAFAESDVLHPMYTVSNLNLINEGMTIYGELYMPETGMDKYPTVILSHGYGGAHFAVENYAIAMVEAGYACYIFDYCGGGYASKSDGSMDDMTISGELKDLNVVIDAIKALDQVDTNNLFLFGESQGGFLSALAGAQRVDEIRGLMLLYPAFVIPENCQMGAEKAFEVTGLPLSEKYCEDGAQYDVYNIIDDYDKNVIILHGDADTLVPISYSEKAVEVYPSAELVVVEGAGHGYGDFEKPGINARCIAFIENNLAA